MKKVICILIVLTTLLCGFAAAESEAKVIAPMGGDLDLSNLPDGIYPVVFDRANLIDTKLTVNIYTEDCYDIVDISTMEVGDTFMLGGLDFGIESLERDGDDDLLINGGLNDNGFTLQVEASFNLNVPRDVGFVTMFGTKAGVNIADHVELYTDAATMFVDIKPTGDTGFDFRGAFNAEIAGFVDAAVNGAACRASAEDGVELMKIIDAIYESAKVRHSVAIN